MTVHVYTSFTFSYFSRARVLGNTLKKHHPDWKLWAIIPDKQPDNLYLDWSAEPFDQMLFLEDLLDDDFAKWIFGLNIVEACTAVKGVAARRILEDKSCDKLLYLDPDIAVLNTLKPIIELLEENAFVLTPHQTQPADKTKRQTILDNEICSLSHGSYNLGFLGLANCTETHRFCSWWDDRLRDWCHDRKEMGLFVDQKWCDLIPSFFDNVKVLRDPGYNVASWNIDYRRVHFDEDGKINVNGVPLRFFHFTKLGPVGDCMTSRYAKTNHEIHELWAWYRREIRDATHSEIPANYWHYGRFDNDVEIPDSARHLYRNRKDLREAFPQPFQVENGFHDWLQTETDLLRADAA